IHHSKSDLDRRVRYEVNDIGMSVQHSNCEPGTCLPKLTAIAQACVREAYLGGREEVIPNMYVKDLSKLKKEVVSSSAVFSL
ncbi:hypothetical protein AVEN_50712-1, partial [Araneus ventricosus]